MAGRIVIEWCRGRVKIFFPNGAQSPKLWPEEVRPWLDAGGAWTRHAVEGWPTIEE